VRARRSGAGARAALSAALALLVVSAAAGSATNASAGQLERVTIATLPFEPVALAFYADAREFFRRHGIEADVKIVQPGTVPATMASGGATFGSLDVGGFLSLKSRGGPVKLVAGSGSTCRTLRRPRS
jgi:ABC-type nitrate/sulfonate/bicarbonate transport system substrate-binding protein